MMAIVSTAETLGQLVLDYKAQYPRRLSSSYHCHENMMSYLSDVYYSF
jgi:hypothetical protein